MDDLTKELQAMNEAEQNDLASSLKEINELANKAFQAKNEAAIAEDKAKELKAALTALMETAGASKISADTCTVSGKIKANASVPKEPSNKLKIFKYIASKDLPEEKVEEILNNLLNLPTLLNMLTFNPTSFNSWYTKEQEGKPEDWKLDFIKIYEYFSIGFRKKK